MQSIIIILLVLYGVVMLLMCYIDIFKNKEKPKNKVHFYVAKDMYSCVYLYLGKPLRGWFRFNTAVKCKCIASEEDFKNFNLDIKDFKDLKWEDEPVEVFLNMED